MMISKKPKPTEEQFLRGASRAARDGSNGSAPGIKRMPFRLPEDLCQRLKDWAWKERVSINALVIEILENAALRGNTLSEMQRNGRRTKKRTKK